MSDEQHWSDSLTHEALVTQEAKTVLSQYKTQDDFMVAGLEAKKMVGAPFRLPKSIESLPDDKTRGEFTSQVNRLMGAVEKEEDLKDVNFADGLADARTVNQDLVAAYKKIGVELGLTKTQFAKLVKWSNSWGQQYKNAQTQAAQKAAQDELNDSRKVLSALFGGDEGIKRETEAVRRMFQNHAGLTAQEYEQTPKAMIDNGLMRDPIYAKALFNLAKNFKESTTEGATAGAPAKKTEQTFEERFPVISGRLWPEKK